MRFIMHKEKYPAAAHNDDNRYNQNCDHFCPQFHPETSRVRGKLTVMVVPTPDSESMTMLPPWFLTIS